MTTDSNVAQVVNDLAVLSGQSVFVINTSLEKGADTVPTALTVDYTDCTVAQLKAIAEKQISVRVQTTFRSDEEIPATYTVRALELANGGRNMSPEQIKKITMEKAKNDPAERDAMIAELLRMKEESVAREKAEAETKKTAKKVA